jgi:hypothetical protein
METMSIDNDTIALPGGVKGGSGGRTSSAGSLVGRKTVKGFVLRAGWVGLD